MVVETTLLAGMCCEHTIVKYGHDDTLSSNSLHPGGLNIQVLARRSCYSACVQLSQMEFQELSHSNVKVIAYQRPLFVEFWVSRLGVVISRSVVICVQLLLLNKANLHDSLKNEDQKLNYKFLCMACLSG